MTKGRKSHHVNVFHEVLVGMDSCDELEYDNTKTVDIALHREIVCGYVHWVYVAISTFKPRISTIKYFFL